MLLLEPIVVIDGRSNDLKSEGCTKRLISFDFYDELNDPAVTTSCKLHMQSEFFEGCRQVACFAGLHHQIARERIRRQHLKLQRRVPLSTSIAVVTRCPAILRLGSPTSCKPHGLHHSETYNL